MNINRLAAIMLRQLYLMRGSFSRVLPLFIWVAIDMVLWGYITKYLNSFSMPGVNFIPTLLGAVLFWDFFIRVMQGVSLAFLEDVWSRNFLNIFSTPLSIGEYVLGLVLWSILTSLVGLVVMIGLSNLVFKLSLISYGFLIVPFILVLFLFGIALGIFASGLVLKLGPAAEWFVWPIPAILSPFAGVFYPLATLPPWMRAVGRLLPVSYVFEGLRTLVSGGTVNGTPLLWGAMLAGGYVLLACWFFKRIYGQALHSGLIARYSAESVS